MTSLPPLAHQRILILAPHPDDESLATGGLIQRAVREGAEIRVLFISDGENNPWPQRFLERRWRIGQRDRTRWAKRRREEALAAMACLGVSSGHAQFLGLPDQGTTNALLRADEAPVAALTEACASWRPTLLVGPSPHDAHPDHNALAVMVDLALARLAGGSDLRLMHYIVHSLRQWPPVSHWRLFLSAEECAIKRQAILKHQSQMALSRRRFVAYARGVEHFYLPGAVDCSQRIRYAGLEDGALCIWIQPESRSEDLGELFVAIESALHGSLRWRVRIPDQSGLVQIQDAVTGQALRNASIRSTEQAVFLRLPISPARPVSRIVLKLNRPTLFYDEGGWYEVALPAKAPEASFVTPALPALYSRRSPVPAGSDRWGRLITPVSD